MSMHQASPLFIPPPSHGSSRTRLAPSCKPDREMPQPTVQWRLPSSSASPAGAPPSSLSVAGKRKGKKSAVLTIVELFFFVVWLVFTGMTGFYFGYDPSASKCPAVSPSAPAVESARQAEPPPKQAQPCLEQAAAVRPSIFETDYPEGGYSFDELKAVWQCSHSVGNVSELHRDIFPSNMNLQKTKWKSILTVEPKAFFEKYLSQYPGDTRATQPVIVFSHKPLENFEELSDVCKVLDIAVVPDRPGVCVAVTETYHDVASYHMLHAQRQEDGKFALSANFVSGRALPQEEQYSVARALLLDYFEHQDAVMQAMRDIPKYGNGKVTVGCFVDDEDDLDLFLNSFTSARKQGVSNNKFAVFTTSSSVLRDLEKTGIKVIHLPMLANVGRGKLNLPPKLRRYFLQSWLAFSAANSLIKMMWQSPATIWMERPDNIVKAFPIVETSWSFKGRNDKRSAPFFVSFDFFVAQGVERPVHFLHELILHFDLIMAWDSLDAVASYRLTENNSRYGTTTFIMPPYKVLHAALMNYDAQKLRQAAENSEKPFVVVLGKDFDQPMRTKQVLMDAGMWFL